MSAHFDRMAKAATVAAKYKANNPHLGAGGYVTLWKMKPTGWTCDLTRSHYCRPGCLAVSDDGTHAAIYCATGGNYWDGASEWTAIWNPAPAPALA